MGKKRVKTLIEENHKLAAENEILRRELNQLHDMQASHRTHMRAARAATDQWVKAYEGLAIRFNSTEDERNYMRPTKVECVTYYLDGSNVIQSQILDHHSPHYQFPINQGVTRIELKVSQLWSPRY